MPRGKPLKSKHKAVDTTDKEDLNLFINRMDTVMSDANDGIRFVWRDAIGTTQGKKFKFGNEEYIWDFCASAIELKRRIKEAYIEFRIVNDRLLKGMK